MFRPLVGIFVHHWGPEHYDVAQISPVRDEGLPAW